MATINRLPIELLALILLYSDEKLPGRCVTTPSRKCFPFNAASVCNLWLDILKSYPQYWRHVLIDLADDPAPFLDTFFLFNKKNRHAALSITVFSSVQGSLALRKDCKKERAQVSLEGHRARTVFKHLEPSLSRYKNITFDLIYQSSLPPATKFLTLHLPLLTRMSLGCQVHNLDDEEIYVDFPQLFFPRFNIFPKLVSLSLTGRSFMELSLLGTNWLDGFKDQLTASFELRVTHFIFSELAAGEGRNWNQAFTTFVKMLCDTKFLLENIHLSDLFVDFDPPSRYKSGYQILTQTLDFEGVSGGFLKALFACCSLYDAGEQTDLIFRRCEIPDNAEEFFGFPRSLELVDIPFHESDNVIDGTSRTPKEHCRVYSALLGFCAHEATLSGCAGVTDDLLNWLGPTGEDIFDEGEVPERGMESLLIENCSGFTVGALRSFIMARAANFPNDAPILTSM